MSAARVLTLVPKPPVVAVPRGLSKAAREEWKRLAPVLRQRGTLTAETEPLLVAYVGAIGMIAEIDRELRGAKLTIKGANGIPRVHPLVGARNRASQNALQFAKRLGIIGSGTPAPSSPKGGDDADPYADLGI
ncbi:P27 family phage terminase small subunit [Methylobacterium sp. J-088]|uniref:P27 family phage terminase small subunit n=1 Tax=Methylobacterium sp. J-088 TaxID=2836664 RepID=UPI001FBA6C91|nr:P27 family phage terminase small subunit [Methylobacterium sp. J-088]MCJ2065046.1 P27 family phage terminase small subunit [Methylobacterium sp. J-088]